MNIAILGKGRENSGLVGDNPDVKTQTGLIIERSYVTQFDLKEGDTITYTHGAPYSPIIVTGKITKEV